MVKNRQESTNPGDFRHNNRHKKGGRPRTGSLYRRGHDGKVISLAGDPTANIWLRYEINGQCVRQSLKTCDVDEARIRRAEIMSAAPGRSTDRTSYLRGLVQRGEWAAAELARSVAIPIAGAWDMYLDSRRRRNPSARMLSEYETRWGQFASWAKDHRAEFFADIGPAEAEAYVLHLEKPHKVAGRSVNLTAATVDTHLQAVRMVWACLSPDTRSPWVGVRSAKELRAAVKPRRMTVDEVRELVRVADGEYRLLVVLGYTTGLRLVDCVHMTADQVDMAAGVIRAIPRKTARRKVARLGGGAVCPPILDDLLNVLPANIAAGYLMPAVVAAYQSGTLGKALAALWVKAGVVGTVDGSASFRSLRVTWQSLNDDAGTSRVVARSVLGHASTGMSDTYSRLDAEKAAAAVKAAIPSITASRGAGRNAS